MRSLLLSCAYAFAFAASIFGFADSARAQAAQPAPQPAPQPPPGYVPAPQPQPPPGYVPAAPPPQGTGQAPPAYPPPPLVYYPAPQGAAPGAAPPQPTPAPPPPPSIIPYEEGDPIPSGYHLESKARMNLVGTGIGLFVPFYAISTLSAAIAEGPYDNPNYWPMYIPTIGPLIAISTAKPDNNFETFMLGLDAAAQTAGLGLIIWGMVAREKRLIRVADSVPALSIAPLHFGRGSFGLGISGAL